MIRVFPDPALLKTATPVVYGGVAAATAAEKLMQAWSVIEPKPQGIAAPQVGLSYRVILINFHGEPRLFYNPEIKQRGDLLQDGIEGCMSLPGVWVSLVRAQAVVISAIDDGGAKIERVAQRETARTFQHEIDHLDGILIVDRITKKDRKRAMMRFDPSPNQSRVLRIPNH